MIGNNYNFEFWLKELRSGFLSAYKDSLFKIIMFYSSHANLTLELKLLPFPTSQTWAKSLPAAHEYSVN